MCYLLYGAVNQEIDKSDYEQVSKLSEFSFYPGTKHNVKMCIQNDSCDYRVTDWVCDCDFPIGTGQPNAKELKELEELLKALKTANGAKYVYLSKTWEGGRNKQEETVCIDDVDIPQFLANAKVNCLYRIDLN